MAKVSEELPSLLRRARQILQCERSCDKACHGCLLAYDTQHSIDKLDRRAALDVLSEQLLAGLELPDDLRVFGERTRLEFANFAEALARELQNAATTRVRLYLGGTAADWELESWPLLGATRRWAASGIGVELAIPSALIPQLSSETCNVLAAWIESDFVRVFALADGVESASGVSIVAELGGESRQVRYGVLGAALPAPNGSWLETIESTRLARITSSEGLGRLSTEVEAGDLREAPPGSLASIDVRTLLNGRVRSFGKRFWKLVSDSNPELQSRLASKVEIASFTYCDRYLYSPLPVKLVLEVIRELVSIGVATERSLVEIQTVHPERDPRRPPQWFNDNWPARTERKPIVQAALERIGSGGRFKEMPKKDLPHARELRIRWTDGATWKMRLDEGFGFMQVQSIPFDFDVPAEDQAKVLADDRFDVSGRILSHFYVFGVEPV